MKCFWEDPTLHPDDFYNADIDRSSADWDKLYANYDAAVDWPSVNFYKDLLLRYPNAQVILTIRDSDSWYESVKKTIRQNALQRACWKPDHPRYAYHRMTSKTCLDGIIADPEKFEEKEMVKRLYEEHNEDVKRNVPEQKLLVMQLGVDTNWETLCKFLGKEVPKGIPYPRSNNSEDFKKYFAPFNANIVV
jgi:hypothetical protein